MASSTRLRRTAPSFEQRSASPASRPAHTQSPPSSPWAAVKRAYRWFYRGPPNDPKMLELWHPLVSCSIAYAIFFVVLHGTELALLRHPLTSPITTASCPLHLLGSVEACRESAHWKHGGPWGHGEESERLRTSLAVFLTVYFLSILGLRTAALGWQNIYESLWGCNVGLIVGAGSFWFNRPLWSASTVFALAIDQMLWYVDVISYLVKGKFVIGVAEYLLWEETHWFKKITCAHHLWFTPMVAYMLYFYPPLPGNSFPLFSTLLLGLVVQFLLVALPRFFLPAYALWPAETQLSAMEYEKARKDKYGRPLTMIYLNVNLSYGPWKDVKLLPMIFSPKWAQNSRWFQYLPYMNIPWACTNMILCLPFFLFL